jgi:3-phosphoshikimate 1-carboxyvinyltransferase
MILRVRPSFLKGTVFAPPSKSVMQRLIAGALLADGASMLHRPSESDDCTAALATAAGLGAEIELGDDAIRITGVAGTLAPRMEELNLGESGLGLRLFAPIAALHGEPLRLTGSGSLLKRPQQPMQEVLRRLGAACELAADGRPPIALNGPLRGGDCAVDGSLSSQFLTGLLFALPLAAEDSTLRVEGLVSRPYVDLTLAVLEDFGIEIDASEEGVYRIRGGQTYQPWDGVVDGDWSAAAALLVAGMLAAENAITVDGLQNSYPQADEAIRGALLFAGGAASGTDEGVQVARRPVRAFNVDLTDSPDLFPVLASLAAFGNKPSTLRGAHRLIHKESNRIASLQRAFEAAGIEIRHDEGLDALVVVPRKGKDKVLAARIDAAGDHRIAMAGALLGLAGAPIEIEGAECVAKSYPAFFDDLEALGAVVQWVKKN